METGLRGVKTLKVDTFWEALHAAEDLRMSGGVIEIRMVKTYTVRAHARHYLAPVREVKIRPVKIDVPPAFPEYGLVPDGFLVIDEANPYADLYVEWKNLEPLKKVAEEGEWFTVKEAMDYLGIRSRTHLKRLIHAGKLRAKWSSDVRGGGGWLIWYEDLKEYARRTRWRQELRKRNRHKGGKP